MKKTVSIFIFFFVFIVNAQTQLGINTGINFTNLKSDDFIDLRSSSGLSMGLMALAPLYKKADWLLNLSYETGNFNAEGYKNFNNEDIIVFSPNIIKTTSIDAKFMVNQYIILPEAASFHIGIQGGAGVSMIANFINKQFPFPEDLAQFKPFYILGISGGTEKYRINLNYNRILGNALKNISVREMPDEFNRSRLREFEGDQSTISLSFTAYLTNFNY